MTPTRRSTPFRRAAPAGAIRTVEVESPSDADEASWLFLTLCFIALCVIYGVAFERNGTGPIASRQEAARALLPYQVLFRDLPGQEQRVFRNMQEGAGEAVRLRGKSGDFPTAEALAAAGIPPFGSDVLDKAGFRWRHSRDGLVVNYIGVPAPAAPVPAFLIFIQEPDPVTGEKAPPPSVVDEEHQLLPDGTLLHVTYWKHPQAGLRPETVVDPAIAGWQQIRVKTPFEEVEESMK